MKSGLCFENIPALQKMASATEESDAVKIGLQYNSSLCYEQWPVLQTVPGLSYEQWTVF